MKTEQGIPYKITEYITNHFKEDFLFEVKDIKEIGGHTIYSVEVSKDDYIHKLRFRDDGTLVKEESEQAFPDDEAFGEVPE